jgi:hypothetical protein
MIPAFGGRDERRHIGAATGDQDGGTFARGHGGNLQPFRIMREPRVVRPNRFRRNPDAAAFTAAPGSCYPAVVGR